MSRSPTLLRRLRPILLRVVALAGIVLVIPFAALLCVYLGERKHLSQKYLAANDIQLPKAQPVEPLTPIAQTEPHTCGLLAISAIFKAYGQDPESADLRFHLGTDRAAVLGRGPADSTGTLHPDVLRVLAQQGWSVSFAENPDSPAPELTEHLARGPALALIALKPLNALHWIALGPAGPGRMRIVDSLQSSPDDVRIEEWESPQTLSLLLLTPRTEDEANIVDAHAKGSLEMARVGLRLRKLNKFTGD